MIAVATIDVVAAVVALYAVTSIAVDDDVVVVAAVMPVAVAVADSVVVVVPVAFAVLVVNAAAVVGAIVAVAAAFAVVVVAPFKVATEREDSNLLGILLLMPPSFQILFLKSLVSWTKS